MITINRPRLFLAGLCILLSLASFYTFFPGWMSQDSFSHYQDALAGRYRDWTPILYSWIWHKFLLLTPGPASMLFLNIFLYWLGFYLLSDGIRLRSPILSYFIPILGLCPSLLYELGYLWKDILFAVAMFVCWAILIRAQLLHKKLNHIERISLVILMFLAYGVKINGITVFPFLAAYWIYIEGLFNKKRHCVKYLLIILIILVPVAAMRLLTATVEVIPKNKMLVQYTMIYDVLGISVRTNTLLLPDYIKERFGEDVNNYRALYYPGGNNHMFFGIGTGGKNAFTEAKRDLIELENAWLSAVKNNPLTYMAHRWANLKGMLRIGTSTPGWIGDTGIIENKFGFKHSSNSLSDLLVYVKDKWSWLFLPWIYILAYFVAIILLVAQRYVHTKLWILLSLSIAGFVGPHFFILPAIDFRYLYFAYIGTLILCVLAIENLAYTLKRRYSAREER